MKPERIGNMEGKYFTRWRIDLLEELLGYVANGNGLAEDGILPVENSKIWYDAEEDFHRLSFDANGKHVSVRLYKVFSAEIDGRDGWVGCPRSQILMFARSIRRGVQG